MKSFMTRTVLFCLPLFILPIGVFLCDPYNLLREEQDPLLGEIKSEISHKINYPLYRLNSYERAPGATIILGDSRGHALKASYFEDLTQVKTFNLAYGGGTLAEVITTFWEVAKDHELKTVYVNINFDLFNGFNSLNRVPEAIEIKDSVVSYLFNTYSAKATIMVLQEFFFNQGVSVEAPPMEREEFWAYQLDSAANNLYRNYEFPTEYYEGLKKISSYCSDKGIELVFLLSPTHVDLQNKVSEFKRQEEYLRFKQAVGLLGDLYDFDYPNALTVDKGNFKDPFHSAEEINKLVVKEIVTGDLTYGRKTAQRGSS